MRYCLHLATMLRASVEDAVAGGAEAGFGAVELWVESLERYLETHTVDDLRNLLERHSVTPLSIGDIESVTFCNADQFEKLTELVGRLSDVASAISCPTLVVSASVRPRGIAGSRIADEISTVLGKLAAITESRGVGVALAFRGFTWCAVNSLEQAQEAVDVHSDRRVGLALDSFDIHASGFEREKLRAVDPAKIFVMRLGDCLDVPAPILSDTDRALPGEGIAEIGTILNTVREAGFAGPVSLKILNPRLWSLEAREIARIVRTATEEFLSERSGCERI